MLPQVNAALSAPFDWSQVPAAPVQAGQTGGQAILDRAQPVLDAQQSRLQTNLGNEGVQQGSDAWNSATSEFGHQQNDESNQAALLGVSVGNTARQDAIQQQEFARSEPIDMLSALQTGNQINMPFEPSTGEQATTSGADLLGAAGSQYGAALSGFNAQQAADNAQTGQAYGAASALAAAAISAAIASSDRRLKRKSGA